MIGNLITKSLNNCTENIMKMATFNQIQQQLLDCGFTIHTKKSKSTWAVYENSMFYIRLLRRDGQNGIPNLWLVPEAHSKAVHILQLGVKKSFDRWANSVDFEVNCNAPKEDISKYSIYHTKYYNLSNYNIEEIKLI